MAVDRALPRPGPYIFRSGAGLTLGPQVLAAQGPGKTQEPLSEPTPRESQRSRFSFADVHFKGRGKLQNPTPFLHYHLPRNAVARREFHRTKSAWRSIEGQGKTQEPHRRILL